ncbi:LysM peptidoglycan-binding domain-containing protein [Aureibaculum sp. 2210JD6-5]|uniref:lytic transglycosylase domain-containing protein n=1 Tax=Aureibaculum sp. 2210JD6-5 TaxID=3103957 RepID=UPI002AAE8ADA|nr:LysM peptidoglycan-binding domain-containing protein [Aureibaculum sp. 2210JD6-5]MDY7396467.1 LysM peptidoglycan-binding domain-containing protein [Aureibaculum sp. 2210JD6-5]
MRFIFISILLLVSSTVFSQKNNGKLDDNKDINQTKTLKISADSLKANPPELIDHNNAKLIDSLWLATLKESSLGDDFQFVDPEEDISDTINSELTTELLKERLAHLNSTTPFNVEYNSSLERLIKHYLKTRKKTMGILMGRAEYYFPMFEEHLDKHNIPMEIKYLAIVESALRPTARSRVGASGLWQFMYYTGKQFDLEVNSYVDERHDPLRATEAACKFLSQLYNTFDDWDLALAAYNSGPGNVSKAIRRSGGSRNYWNIRHNLPRETAGYLPAFYATLYLMEYAKEHDIVPQKFFTNRFETDTIVVKQQITFDQINKVLNTDDELLEHLNPQYKLKIIPYVKEKNYTLRLPVHLIGKFVSNEEQIYAYAKEDLAKREKQLPKFQTSPDKIRYRVRNGDYLGKIAQRYGVGVSQIKRWNGLRSNNLRIGQRLTIYPKNYKTASSSSNKTTTESTSKSTPKGSYTTYTVKKGDSLWIISKKFPKVSVEQIKNWNNIWSVKNLKPGTKLKIYKS